MARTEQGFKGAKLVGVTLEDATVLEAVIPADTENGIEEGTLQETISALAARIKALEEAAEA